MTRHLIRVGAAIMTTLLALAVVWQFKIVVAYLLISLALAAVLRPWANRLIGRSLVVRLAWIGLYVAVVGIVGYGLFLTVDAAFGEIQRLVQTLSPDDAWRLPLWLQASAFWQSLIARLPPPSEFFEALTGSEGQLVVPVLLGFTQGIGGIVGGAVVIIFMSIYWSISQNHFERLWLSLLPSGQRTQARGIWRTIEPDIGAYTRAEITHGLLAGLLLGLGYWLLGSPYPALLALTGALLSLVPVVGVPLAIIPVLLVGLLTDGQLTLLTTAYALAIFVGIGVWIKPRLFDRQWHQPMLTLILLIALADALGLLGLFLAPPLAVVLRILWKRLVSRRAAAVDSDPLSDLKARQARVQQTIEAMDEPPLPLVVSSMGRLTQLIEKAEPVLLASAAPDHV